MLNLPCPELAVRYRQLFTHGSIWLTWTRVQTQLDKRGPYWFCRLSIGAHPARTEEADVVETSVIPKEDWMNSRAELVRRVEPSRY